MSMRIRPICKSLHTYIIWSSRVLRLMSYTARLSQVLPATWASALIMHPWSRTKLGATLMNRQL
jgi:hypothetical protein